MLRATGNIDGPGPGEAADQSADSGAGVPGGADVGILQHGVTKSPHDAIRGSFRLGKNIDQPVSRARIGYIFEAEPHTLQRRDHRGGINRVAHDAMSDDKGARRRIRVAQQDYHVMHELNTGRSGGHRRKQTPVFQDLLIADAAVDLAERRRDAEGRRAARISHRSIGAGRYGLVPLGMGRFDAVAGQQRTFDLHKMHVLRIINAGIRHGGADGPCGLLDLRAAAELLRHEITGVCDADAQTLAGNAFVGTTFG